MPGTAHSPAFNSLMTSIAVINCPFVFLPFPRSRGNTMIIDGNHTEGPVQDVGMRDRRAGAPARPNAAPRAPSASSSGAGSFTGASFSGEWDPRHPERSESPLTRNVPLRAQPGITIGESNCKLPPCKRSCSICIERAAPPCP